MPQTRSRRPRVIHVEFPDPHREQMVKLSAPSERTDAVRILQARGLKTSHATIHRWRIHGMPVCGRSGPRVRFPAILWGGWVHTSLEAIRRFIDEVVAQQTPGGTRSATIQ